MSYNLTQYRCTRPDLYGPGSLGFDNLSARQGHYIFAESEDEAVQQMVKKFPDDSRFDVQVFGTLAD